MRKLIAALLFLCCLSAKAQVYNNEWIDYAKTYYKFKVAKDGLYRITGAQLSAVGLSAATAPSFQLWRNGVQIPIYTSVTSGTLGAADYIEFWGKMNDGKPDRELFRQPEFQLNDRWSLISDSAAYFLTINTAGGNLRLENVANPVAINTLPVEPYFLHTEQINFRERVNSGLFYLVGRDKLFSSSYDKGEGWSSGDIARGSTGNFVTGSLYAATSGPAPKLSIAIFGNEYNSRRYKATVNNDSVAGHSVPYLNQWEEEVSFPLTLLGAGQSTIGITNINDCDSTSCPGDGLVVFKLNVTYPRQFNFGGAQTFEFSLPASASGQYLEIAGFNTGGTPPVLYDLTNGRRYTGDINGSTVRFVVQPSSTVSKLVLVSEAPTNKNAVTSMQPRTFINYTATQNQADYIIISNPLLFTGAGGTNPVEEYRAYRSSVQGGGYNTKIYLDDQLADQFGFGIKKNPAAIRNFIRYARNKYVVKPKQIFLIGRGINYLGQYGLETHPSQTVKDNLEKLNLVPTYGWPASDLLLAAEPGTSIAATPIGRLTAITPAEVSVYLKKVKDLEQAQQSSSASVGDKAWMKNFAHMVGAGDADLALLLKTYLDNYKRTIEDTLYGAKVYTFEKTSTNTVEQLNDAYLTKLFSEGLSVVTYYGHSSPITLEFNLDDPANYNNQGKYPMFLALGCNAGNTFDYTESRFTLRNYLSDKYVLEPERGSINFIASSHFGIVHYLDIWNSRAYVNMATTMYGRSIGEIMKKTVEDVYGVVGDDFFARCNAEETILNGDPAVKLNQYAKPDYAITDSMVKVAPNFISVAEQSFKVDVKILNLGKAVSQNIVVETKRQFPDQSVLVIRRDTIRGIRYADSLSFRLPIDPNNDKGTNRVYITVDADGVVDEQFETNNSTYREFIIFEDEARPIYPQNYGIVSSSTITLRASTANPFSVPKQYRMEIDTTALFNSPLKATNTITSGGGLMEFTPGISFTDSTVYYWRVAPVPATGDPAWANSSFIYLGNAGTGFNQSHYYQQTKSEGSNIALNPVTRRWDYDSIQNNLTVRSGVFVSAATQEAQLAVTVNGVSMLRSACAGNTIVFNLFNPNTFKPRPNPSQAYGSDPTSCAPSRQWNFAFNFTTPANRKKAMDFMDSIPDGWFVIVRNILVNGSQFNYTASAWKADEAIFGPGNSLYHKLKAVGFDGMDSITHPRVFSFIYQKNTAYSPSYKLTANNLDLLLHSANMNTPDSIGHIVSPRFGPVKSWKQLVWNGQALEAAQGDNSTLSVIGIRSDGATDVLYSGVHTTQPVYDISSVDAKTYPYIQLALRNADSVHFTPYQLGYWRLMAELAPEGAVAPAIQYSFKDTVDVGEPIAFKLAFKNISDNSFLDSMKMKAIVYDRTNTARVIPVVMQKSPKNTGDVLSFELQIDTKQIVGSNTLFVEFNPDNNQPEQLQFNNFVFRDFFVRGDTLNPLLDVTFDNVHILNQDIVSSKPDILVKLKDEAKWMLMNDPSVATVQVRYPDDEGRLTSSSVTRTFNFNNADTLRFIPATGAPNAANTASIEFNPYFERDGEYELIITGKDMSSNAAGTMSYRVAFQIINKAMISNMLNYPNPFTTSTAFVFTLTGAEIPQNIKIQVLTVTGKIVREITKEELGPLRIGRNITEFKWDGTDQYGQKLGNGVYLYRVVTNLNGKSMDKYTAPDEATDKYFNKGYGKMYLMR